MTGFEDKASKGWWLKNFFWVLIRRLSFFLWALIWFRTLYDKTSTQCKARSAWNLYKLCFCIVAIGNKKKRLNIFIIESHFFRRQNQTRTVPYKFLIFGTAINGTAKTIPNKLDVVPNFPPKVRAKLYRTTKAIPKHILWDGGWTVPII